MAIHYYRQQTPVPAARTSRPHTPLRVLSAQSEVIQVQPAQSEVVRVLPSQSEVIQVAPSQSLPDSPSSTTTITDTQMNTVSEGEWILKSDGQITPRGKNSQITPRDKCSLQQGIIDMNRNGNFCTGT